MAGRSQLPVQIMENQTRYDLNAAIENWRNELAAQPNLASDDRRELETHLRDAIAGFQQRGLNDEESFWLARRRIGQPRQLGEEFVKANPNQVWRERVFWMASAILLAFLWSDCVFIVNAIISRFIINNHLISNSAWFIPFQVGFLMFLRILPLFGLAVLLAKGCMRGDSILAIFARMRFPISILTSVWFTASGVIVYLQTVSYNKAVVDLIGTMPLSQEGVARIVLTPGPAWAAFGNRFIFPLLLLALVLWLMPTQNPKTLKRA
jgi:hypothetical protein